MPDSHKTLAYLSEAARLGGGPEISFEAGHTWEVGMRDVALGALGAGLTEVVFAAYRDTAHEMASAELSVGVLVGMLLLREDGQDVPLLYVPARLDRTGALRSVEGTRPWIALGRLRSDVVRDSEAAIADLDTYRAYQNSMSTLACDFSWAQVVERAQDLVRAVATTRDGQILAGTATLDSDRCLIRLFEHLDAHLAAAEILSGVASDLDAGTLTPSVARLLGEAGEEEPDDLAQVTDERLITHKLVCGLPAEARPLDANDHAVISALSEHQREPLISVGAPLGTSACPVALAAVANAICESALRGDEMVRTLVVGPEELVSEALALFSANTRDAQTSLFVRWLPRIAGDGTRATRRILGPLPYLCALHVSDATPEALSEQAMRIHCACPSGHAGTPYAQGWYLPQAQTYYLDCVSAFLGRRIRDVAEGKAALSERLRIVDQIRCELVDAYFEIVRATEQMASRDELLEHLGELRRAHRLTRARLERWEQLWRRHPQPLARIGSILSDQTSLIARNAEQGERLVEGKRNLEEVVEAYRNELMRIEDDIDRLRATTTQLNRRIRAAEPAGGRARALVGRLLDLLRLDRERQLVLKTILDGTNVTLQHLSEVLDLTVRPAEFWLAVHVFEADWVAPARRADIVERRSAWDGWSHLLPIALATTESAPQVLATAARQAPAEGQEGHARAGRVDLMVLLGANRLDVALGTALVSCAEQVLVVGTNTELACGPYLGRTFDSLSLVRAFADEAEEVRSTLSLDGTASLFDLVRQVEGVPALELTDDAGTCAPLADLRAELAGRRVVSAGAAHGTEVWEVVPPVSFVLVPDSSFEPCGGSTTNVANARALMRWLDRHASELAAACGDSVAVVCATRAQASLMRTQLAERGFDLVACALADVGRRRWSCVIFDTVCGADALRQLSSDGLGRILGTASAAATVSLMLVLGPAWLRTADPCARALMERATCIGRLFSAQRTRATGVEARSKALSATQVLERLLERGDIDELPQTADLNRALAASGLIERVRIEGASAGWRPTTAGSEVGIVATTDPHGTPFCLYEASAEAVVARVVADLSAQGEEAADGADLA